MEDASRAYSRQSTQRPELRQLEDEHDNEEEEEEGTVRPEQDRETAYNEDYPQTPHMTVPIDTPRADPEEFYDDEEDDIVDVDPTDGGETRSKFDTHYDGEEHGSCFVAELEHHPLMRKSFRFHL